MDTRIAKLEADLADLQERIEDIEQTAKIEARDKSIDRFHAFLKMALSFEIGVLFWQVASRFPPP